LSEPAAPESAPEPESAAPPETVAARFDLFQRAGGVVVPVITALMAFVIGGIILALSGYNPFTTYWEIAQGAGLDWFGNLTTNTGITSAYNFSQTLNTTTTLILTGLAVAFAFRCGLFNIGGQGQYLVGLIVANWIGVSMAGLAGPAHVLLAIVLATLAGAIWAGFAGFLKATTGAHEVISTIMLNWIAIYVGAYVFGQGGPLQGSQPSAPISATIVPSAVIKFFWGDPTLGGVNVGFFIALAMLVVFWAILSRTTLGYEIRAVGYNPDAAAYGGISVSKNYIRAMAISGGFAGLAGGIDMLGTYNSIGFGTLDVYGSSIGFLGIAVALLGRNTALGTGIAAFLFGGLLFGTTHGLSTSAIPAQLTGNLTLIIQGLIVLFVGADVLILYLWSARRKLRRRIPGPGPGPEPEPTA
jgi:general nucleoside transport system permease protein